MTYDSSMQRASKHCTCHALRQSVMQAYRDDLWVGNRGGGSLLGGLDHPDGVGACVRDGRG